MGGTFSSFLACVRAATLIFKDALARADHAEKRASKLEEQCKGYRRRLSWVEKDLQVSQLQVNKYILHAKSLQLELDGAKKELASARSDLELAHKNHKE